MRARRSERFVAPWQPLGPPKARMAEPHSTPEMTHYGWVGELKKVGAGKGIYEYWHSSAEKTSKSTDARSPYRQTQATSPAKYMCAEPKPEPVLFVMHHMRQAFITRCITDATPRKQCCDRDIFRIAHGGHRTNNTGGRRRASGHGNVFYTLLYARASVHKPARPRPAGMGQHKTRIEIKRLHVGNWSKRPDGKPYDNTV